MRYFRLLVERCSIVATIGFVSV